MAKEYFVPKSIEEGLSLLQKYGDDAMVIAGATDVFGNRRSLKQVIIDITDIGLDYVNFEGNELKVGACTTFSELIYRLSGGKFNIVADAACSLGSPQIRNVATIGGNLCGASPAADSAPPLYVLDAKVKLTGPSGSRVLPIEEFIIGPHETAREPQELLEEIQVVQPSPEMTYAEFDKVKRVKGKDLAIVNGAVAISFDSMRNCENVRICLGAVAPTPLRVKAVEKLIKGKQLSEELISEAAEKAADATNPINDHRSSAEYRRLRSRVLVQRALIAADRSAAD